jgi:uncharacterized membrane protein
VNTTRLEAFSDGVMAVAITLLVLDIRVPQKHLGHELAQHWPTYLAYVTSFITIGIIWINHHVMIGRLARADHSILILNLLLLLTIAVIPFGTSLIATYLRRGHGANLAAGIYGGVLLAMAVAFSAVNGQILFRRTHLLKVQLSLAERRRILMRGWSGLIPYVVATGMSAISPYFTVAITAALALFYALPIASSPDN